MPTARESARFTDEQLHNARAILSVGRSLGASNRDLLIALMAAFQESGLRNLNYGDRDSIGLFQQRNGWGSRAARLDPVQSARMFFTGGAQGQRGLLDFSQRNQWSLTQAAQKVQVSAFPDAYAKHEGRARELLTELGSSAGDFATAKPTNFADDLEQALQGSVVPMQPQATPADAMSEGVKAATMPGLEAGDEQAKADLNATSPLDGGILPDMDEPTGPPMSFLSPDDFAKQFPMTGVNGGGKRELAIRAAKGLLGTPYAWGGTDSSGIDCSGLVQWALKAAGVKAPRISFQQANMGKRVGLNQLRPGDLVAWDNSSRNNGADHIAIYLGNGQIIEAPRTGLSVRIRSLGGDENFFGVHLDY